MSKVKIVKQTKRHEAEQRQAAFDGMTLLEQLKKLDRVPGESRKERAKIARKIQEEGKK